MAHGDFDWKDMFLTRREMLSRMGNGFAALGLTGLLSEAAMAEGKGKGKAVSNPAHRPPATSHQAPNLNPLSVKNPPFPATAKRVIFLFMNGGPSHVDTFDPKPMLTQNHGKPLPYSNFPTERKTGTCFGSPFKFQKHGQSGIEVSEIFPHMASCVDDMAIIRSMHADVPNHEPSLLLMNCGEGRLVRPSMGSWITYGLGTENQNLPGFIAMCPGGYPIQDTQNWQAGFLPGVYQGTYIDPSQTDMQKVIEHIKNNYESMPAQRQQLDLLHELNAKHAAQREEDAQLESRIQSFELAYRMQMDATDAFDISKEPAHIREMYGEGVYARQLLIATPTFGARRSLPAIIHGRGAAVGQPRRHCGRPPRPCQADRPSHWRIA